MEANTLLQRAKRKMTVLLDSRIRISHQSNGKPTIFVFGASSQSNYGDLAISYAQERFIKRNFPEYNYSEILDYQTESGIKAVANILTPKDIIVISGGGNLGNLYMFSEENRRHVVSRFPNNLVISFPQSFFYTDDQEGKFQEQISAKIYGDNKKLVFFARESLSKERMKKVFTNDVHFCPDIVLSLNKQSPTIHTRSGILAVLRNDREKLHGHKSMHDVAYLAKSGLFGSVIYSDNNLPRPMIVKRSCRENILEERFKLFRSAKLVITDRLHGMIFSVITGTPCVIYDNANGKVKYSYLDWLSNIPNILLADRMGTEEILSWAEGAVDSEFSSPDLSDCYSDLISILRCESISDLLG